MKVVVLIAIVAAAAGVVVGIACLWVSHMDSTSAHGLRAYRRRSLDPRSDRFVTWVLQNVFMVAGGFAARKVLRLRL